MLTKEAILEHYPNGQLEWKIPIEWHVFGHYRMHGEAIQYYMNSDGSLGPVKLRRTYDHGVETGDEIIYYRDGKILSRLSFKDGLKDGAYVFNHPDGSREEALYANGEMVLNSAKQFDKEGNERRKQKGEPDSKRDPEPKKILPGDHIPSSLAK